MTCARFATVAMGTRFEVVLEDDGRADVRAAAEAAIDEIEEWHRRLSRFVPDSLLTHINRTAAAEPVQLDRETFALLGDAVDVWRASEGAFDITVAPLMDQHGFSPSACGGHPGGDSRAIVLDTAAWTIRFSRPGISLDLGAIAKGHALDRAAANLRENGVTVGLLHGGTSSVIALGAPAGCAGWVIEIGSNHRRQTVALRDNALGVSDPASQPTSASPAHIFDPRSGRPVTRPGRATVVGPSARLADAWSTALAVLGRRPPGFPAEYCAILDHECQA